MRPASQKSGIAGLLLLALLYAWLGHDLHQHHRHSDGPVLIQHHSQGEASHTKAIPGAKGCVSPLVVVALLVTLGDFSVSQQVALSEPPTFDERPLLESQFWSRPNSPRAPPAGFSLS